LRRLDHDARPPEGVAVSADGGAFFDGLIADNATGIVDQPRPARFKACTNPDYYVGVSGLVARRDRLPGRGKAADRRNRRTASR
jgi:hypothetical protein